ncbi:MAG: hypothetical protein ACLUNZ_08240 [Evtepia sp.]
MHERWWKVMLEKNKYAVDLVHNGNDALDYSGPPATTRWCWTS